MIRKMLPLALIVLLGGCAEEDRQIEYEPIPPSILTPDRVGTRLGALDFFDGYPGPDTVETVYENLDTILGRLLEYTDSDTTVLLVSDHGFGGASDRIVRLARWLEQEGYATLHPVDSGSFERFKTTGKSD